MNLSIPGPVLSQRDSVGYVDQVITLITAERLVVPAEPCGVVGMKEGPHE